MSLTTGGVRLSVEDVGRVLDLETRVEECRRQLDELGRCVSDVLTHVGDVLLALSRCNQLWPLFSPLSRDELQTVNSVLEQLSKRGRARVENTYVELLLELEYALDRAWLAVKDFFTLVSSRLPRTVIVLAMSVDTVVELLGHWTTAFRFAEPDTVFAVTENVEFLFIENTVFYPGIGIYAARVAQMFAQSAVGQELQVRYREPLLAQLRRAGLPEDGPVADTCILDSLFRHLRETGMDLYLVAVGGYASLTWNGPPLDQATVLGVAVSAVNDIARWRKANVDPVKMALAGRDITGLISSPTFSDVPLREVALALNAAVALVNICRQPVRIPVG